MNIRNTNFLILPDGEVEIRTAGEVPYILDVQYRGFIELMIGFISNTYPVAFLNLKARYQRSEANTHYFEMLIVRGFIKCNFEELNNKHHIDEAEKMSLQYVHCPLSGECKEWRETCQPMRKTPISDAELRVLRLIADGKQTIDIADELYLSPKTVENHTHNMLRKLGVHNNASLTSYYHTHLRK